LYQTRFNLDPEENLDLGVVLINDPRWEQCIQDWRTSKVFGVDTETYGEIRKVGKKKYDNALDPRRGKIRLIQIGLLNGLSMVADLGGWTEDRSHLYSEFLSILKTKMEDKSVIKVGQNLKFEMTFFLWKFGIHTRNIRDTMLMSQTLWAIGGSGDKYRHNLGAIGERCGFEVSKEQQKSDWAGTLSNTQLNYAAKDAYIVLPIATELKKRLLQENLWETAMVENLNCPAVAEREYWGLPIVTEVLDELISSYTKAAHSAVQPFLKEFPGVNPKSPKQIVNCLNDRYGLNLEPPQRGEKGKTKKKKDNKNKMILLENTHIPAVDSLVLYRSLMTQTGTYLKSIKENTYNGFTRSKYFQITRKGVGRSSSRDPNLQNAANHAPRWEEMGLKHPRSAFKAPPGFKMIVADLSQAHMRIAAEFSQDPVLIDAFNDDRDIHSITAAAQAQARGLGSEWSPENILKWRKDKAHPNSSMAEVLRKTSKNVNYGSLNAQGGATLQRTMAVSRDPVFIPLDECKEMIWAWRGLYSTLSATHKKIAADANSYDIKFPGLPGKFGMTVGLSGRKVYFQKTLQTHGTETSWSVKYTDAISSIWLGTEAHILKKAEYLILEELDKLNCGWHIGNSAHDELDLWGPEEHAETVAIIVNKIMDDCMKEFVISIPVNEPNYDPLKTICDSWSDK